MKSMHQLLDAKGGSILSVPPSATIYDALLIMAAKHVGALLVMEGERLAGIFSERDYARSTVLKSGLSKDTPISEVMTPASHLITITPSHTVEECLNLVTDKRIRHLPVMENGKVIGVLSIGDLVKETIAHQQFLISQLESYIHS